MRESRVDASFGVRCSDDIGRVREAPMHAMLNIPRLALWGRGWHNGRRHGWRAWLGCVWPAGECVVELIADCSRLSTRFSNEIALARLVSSVRFPGALPRAVLDQTFSLAIGILPLAMIDRAWPDI